MAALRDSRLAVFVAHLQEGRGGRHDGHRKLVLAEAAREDRRRHVDLLSERNNNNNNHLNKYIKLNGVFSEMMERKIKTHRQRRGPRGRAPRDRLALSATTAPGPPSRFPRTETRRVGGGGGGERGRGGAARPRAARRRARHVAALKLS